MKLKKTSENQINETWADKWFILDQDGQIELNQKYLSNTWLLIKITRNTYNYKHTDKNKQKIL